MDEFNSLMGGFAVALSWQNMLFMLVGVTLLFAQAQVNGTLDKLSSHAVRRLASTIGRLRVGAFVRLAAARWAAARGCLLRARLSLRRSVFCWRRRFGGGLGDFAFRTGKENLRGASPRQIPLCARIGRTAGRTRQNR